MNALVSIIMPCKNETKFLAETLNSIAQQSYTNFELVVVDDFSEDNSLAYLKAFALTSKFPMLVLKNENVGIINALQLAYKNTSGKYITRMDADDRMHKDKLKDLIEILEEKGLGHVATSYVKYFSESDYQIQDGYKKYEAWLNGLAVKCTHFDEIYKECVIPSPNWMLHKEDLDRIGAFNSTTYPEDYDLCFRMYKGGLEVKGVQKVLHYWRDYADRTSRNDPNYADNRFLTLKLNYFLELDYQSKNKLFVWGTGKKGKFTAKHLIQNSIEFYWISNNLNKIGLKIYNKEIQSYTALGRYEIDSIQLMLMVAGESNQKEIKSYLKQMDSVNIESFWFC